MRYFLNVLLFPVADEGKAEREATAAAAAQAEQQRKKEAAEAAARAKAESDAQGSQLLHLDLLLSRFGLAHL